MCQMTPRQRWLALLNREQPDRVPTDYWATGEVTQRLMRDLSCADSESLWRKLGVDRPRGVAPRPKSPFHPDTPDMWGIRHQSVDYGTGAYREAVFHPLATAQMPEDVHAHHWPHPDDFDYQPIADALLDDDRYRPIQGGSYEPFLLYCKMRGMEQAYEDLLVSPDIAEAALDHIFDFYFEHNRRILESGAGRIDLFYLAEDLGSQTGPLMSLDTYRHFLRPHQKQMANLAKSFGAHVFYHTDGAARPFIPDLIDDVGIEILNPIQWRCPTMELKALVSDFGKRVIFHGAIDNQQTLPFGSECDVRREVEEALEIFGPARWICAPCHNLQPVTPTANIVELYQTVNRSH